MHDVDPLVALGEVDAELLTGVDAWLRVIPFDSWPQQKKVDSQLRPAMVNDPAWYDFAGKTDTLVASLMPTFIGCVDRCRMLSVVMPGHRISPHRDRQVDGWLTRVHVPIATNDLAFFGIGNRLPTVLVVGVAYAVDVRQEHFVENLGWTPRVHFMFDVVRR